MPTRFLVLCPDSASASGGVQVLYTICEILTAAGHDALIVHEQPGFRHVSAVDGVEVGYTDRLGREWLLRERPGSLRGRLARFRRLRRPPWDSFELRSDDVIVIPDVFVASAAKAFPDNRKVLFCQNPYLLIQYMHEARQRGVLLETAFELAIGISDTCLDVIGLEGITATAKCPVGPKLELFAFQETKRRAISYMPRRRPEEAALLDRALRRRNRLQGYDLVPIDGLPHDAAARLLRESRIFLSLVKDEGLAFPVAEAMASGSIVVGYTGHAPEEYFDSSTGVPVREGSPLQLVELIEETVAAYDRDPAPYDKMRRCASERVNARFSRAVFRDSLLEALAPMLV